MSNAALRVLIVDAHPIVRHGVGAILRENGLGIVCGEVATPKEAAAKLQELQPDIVVLEFGSEYPNGTDGMDEIACLTAQSKVLIFGDDNTEVFVPRAFRAGASGFVLKSEDLMELKAAIEALAVGGIFLGRRVSGSVLESILSEPDEGKRILPRKLTDRQRQIVRLLAGGQSNKEAGASLGLTSRTVETHRRIIMKKLGIGTFSDLVRFALHIELIPPWPAEIVAANGLRAEASLQRTAIA